MNNNSKFNKVYVAVHGDSWLKQAHYCRLLMGVRLIKHSTPSRKANQLENVGQCYSQRKGMKVLMSTWEERGECWWHGFQIHAYYLARYTTDLRRGGHFNRDIVAFHLTMDNRRKTFPTFSPPIFVAFIEMTFFCFLYAFSCYKCD